MSHKMILNFNFQKKCPEYLLGSTMLENAGEDGSLMSFALTECGKVQHALATETVEHESKVEQYVTSPLQHILDTDVPNIMKHKRNLARLTLDMDSIRTRYHQASKHNAGGEDTLYRKEHSTMSSLLIRYGWIVKT